MLDDPFRWRQAVRQYADLQNLKDGITPQARGQRFNGVIADLLSAFGIPARSDDRSAGEIDVIFNHADRHFILEAKWVQAPTDTGPIAKLQRRLEQRLSGVTGVFLAMSGYSKAALAEIDKGRRLDVLLLDREHWDAMVSGIVPAPELIRRVVEAASFQGKAYIKLTKLVSQVNKSPEISLEPSVGREGLLARGESDVPTSVVLDGIDSRRVDLTLRPGGKLLVTVDHGVLAVDLRRRQVNWATPIDGCANAVELSDGSVVACRGEGVSRYREDMLTAVTDAEGEPLHGQLLPRSDGSVWCLRSDSSSSAGLLRLEPSMDQRWSPVQAPMGTVTGAAWLTSSDLVIAGGPELVVVSTSGAPQRRIDVTNSAVVGLTGVGGGRFVAVYSNGDVRLTDATSARQLLLGRLPNQAYCGMTVDPGNSRLLYLATRYRDGDGRNLVAVLQLKLPDRWKPVVVPPAPRAAGKPVDTVASTPVGRPSKPRVATTPAAPPSAVDSPEQRNAERGRGRRDGQVLGLRLPMEAMAGLVTSGFDLVRWLEPGRESWRRCTANGEPVGSALPVWFPQFAEYLGQYAAPAEALEGHFKPPVSYVLGFVDGLRAVWDSAVRADLVPRAVAEIGYWLYEPVVPSRLQLSITELRTGARSGRRKAAARSTGHIVLWIVTALAAVLEFGAIGASASGGFPNGGDVIGANIFFALVFLVPLFFALAVPRRIRAHRRKRSERS